MNWVSIFPFIAWMRLTSKETVKADFIAGFTGAVIVLPQGVAFAAIAGLPPEYGLYTAIITPIIAALFGSSFHLISGPTTAISLVVFTVISNHADPGSADYISLTLTLTFLAGVYQLGFGLLRFGSLINFISHTVIIGFTAGAAILIVTSQIKNIFGVTIAKGESFIHTWMEFYAQITSINFQVLGIAFCTFMTALIVKRFYPKSPHLLIGLIVGSIAGIILGGEANGINLVGEIPARLPPISSPDFSFATIKKLMPEAFAVALLGLIEAVSISRSIATQTKHKINSNQEFIGQGLSNIVGSFFSSYAGSGSFTRSGINYSSGAKTPLSAIISAVLLVLIVLLIAPLTAYLPHAAMGGVILIVAAKLINVHQISHVLKNSNSETATLLITFMATVFLELEFAIYLGVLSSLFFFLARTSTPRIQTLAVVSNYESGKRTFECILDRPMYVCPQLKIIRIDMSIYFGSIEHIQNNINNIIEKEKIHHILIVATGINFIDLSGAEMLESEHEKLQALGGGLYFTGIKPQVENFAEKVSLLKHIGEDHFFSSKEYAIAEIYKRLDKDICSRCSVKVFQECNKSPKNVPLPS